MRQFFSLKIMTETPCTTLFSASTDQSRGKVHNSHTIKILDSILIKAVFSFGKTQIYELN